AEEARGVNVRLIIHLTQVEYLAWAFLLRRRQRVLRHTVGHDKDVLQLTAQQLTFPLATNKQAPEPTRQRALITADLAEFKVIKHLRAIPWRELQSSTEKITHDFLEVHQQALKAGTPRQFSEMSQVHPHQIKMIGLADFPKALDQFLRIPPPYIRGA